MYLISSTLDMATMGKWTEIDQQRSVEKESDHQASLEPVCGNKSARVPCVANAKQDTVESKAEDAKQATVEVKAVDTLSSSSIGCTMSMARTWWICTRGFDKRFRFVALFFIPRWMTLPTDSVWTIFFTLWGATLPRASSRTLRIPFGSKSRFPRLAPVGCSAHRCDVSIRWPISDERLPFVCMVRSRQLLCGATLTTVWSVEISQTTRRSSSDKQLAEQSRRARRFTVTIVCWMYEWHETTMRRLYIKQSVFYAKHSDQTTGT